MIVIRVINLSNAKLQVGEDYINPKMIKDFPLDISDDMKKQLVAYACANLAKVFEVEIKETKTAPSEVDDTSTEPVSEEVSQPKQTRSKSKKK